MFRWVMYSRMFISANYHIQWAHTKKAPPFFLDQLETSLKDTNQHFHTHTHTTNRAGDVGWLLPNQTCPWSLCCTSCIFQTFQLVWYSVVNEKHKNAIHLGEKRIKSWQTELVCSSKPRFFVVVALLCQKKCYEFAVLVGFSADGMFSSLTIFALNWGGAVESCVGFFFFCLVSPSLRDQEEAAKKNPHSISHISWH